MYIIPWSNQASIPENKSFFLKSWSNGTYVTTERLIAQN